MSTLTTTTYEEIRAGDIVAVNHGIHGRKEGLVVGTRIDYAGRQIVEVQFEPGDYYSAWYPQVTRVRRTISYGKPKVQTGQHTVERHVYW
ncbi:hypothetical protein BD410DRAFT_47545 [Rickenella mellea]|uniref:Hypervirulence associated protein TUDOR domain-containing protein n=1 Tax=Rickenella mellea TaxID=50990 RepID=A0A4R5XFM0_9AGAM|nr:hypothetical protein BD410DRAFT_47545 [Rickenella mellea]